MKLWGAYKLHLHGVDAVKLDTTNGGGKTVKDGEYVVKGAVVDFDGVTGVNLICINDKSYAVGPISDITVSADNDQIAAATKITLNQGSSTPVITMSIRDNSPQGWSEITQNATNSTQDVYVVPSATTTYSVVGDTINADGKTTIDIKNANVAAGDSGANSASQGAWAYFTVTGDDDVTVAEKTAP